jgi:hypothetical protein
MALSDIQKEWYDDDGVRHWILKSNPSVRYDDRYDRKFTSHYINETTKNLSCPLDNRKCDYKMIILADPTQGYNNRFCRYNHNMKINKDQPPCKKELEREKKIVKSKSKRKIIKKCRCK